MTKWLLIMFAMVFVPNVRADGIDALTRTTNAVGTQDDSVTLQGLAIMTALSFVPAAIIMLTSFTRLIVVLALLRHASGLQQTP
ncbi:flagellar biosynthetic protein FliP, partial [Pseudoalteromonas sp. SIMBA_148]